MNQLHDPTIQEDNTPLEHPRDIRIPTPSVDECNQLTNRALGVLMIGTTQLFDS